MKPSVRFTLGNPVQEADLYREMLQHEEWREKIQTIDPSFKNATIEDVWPLLKDIYKKEAGELLEAYATKTKAWDAVNDKFFNILSTILDSQIDTRYWAKLSIVPMGFVSKAKNFLERVEARINE